MDFPLSKYLTIIITTSPVKSNPDTQMFQSVLKSFELVKGLSSCRKLLVCDGYKVSSEGEYRFKKGLINPDCVSNYKQYIQNLKLLEIENCRIIERQDRFGFALNLLHCLEIAETEFVLVVQHDQTFMRSVDMEEIIGVMNRKNDVNYVGFLSSST